MLKFKNLVLLLILSLSIMGIVSSADARYDREDANDAGYVNAISYSYDKAAVAKPAFIYAVTIYPTTSSAVVRLWDNASAATGVVKVEVESGVNTNGSRREVFNPPIKMNNGVYLDITGTASAVIEYR